MAQKPRRIIGTSLKMYFDIPRTESYIEAIASLAPLIAKSNIDLFLIPDFLSIYSASRILRDTPILLGAQDVFHETSGPFTGEISPLSLQQLGVQIAEVGHAERRHLFGETDEMVGRKAAAAARHGLIPLICVGETRRSMIASEAVGAAVEECRLQVMKALMKVPAESEVLLAYEPVWAIGASEPADAGHVVHVVGELRKIVGARTGACRILYGGSAGPGTWARIGEAVDGLFLGRFAHEVDNLRRVIDEVAEL